MTREDSNEGYPCPACGGVYAPKGMDNPDWCPWCEVERLQADFTGGSSQPQLEQIRAKCEQYWNEPFVCTEEFHAILEFIHGRAWPDEAARKETTDAI